MITFLILRILSCSRHKCCFPSKITYALFPSLINPDFPMNTHKLHLISIITCIRSGTYPSHLIARRHIIAFVSCGIVHYSKYRRTHDFRFAIFGRWIVEAIILVRSIRDVVEHKLAAFFTKSLLCHQWCLSTTFVSKFLYVR